MKQLKNFPSNDGHIESILIGSDVVKVLFQTWDCRKLVIIYNDVAEVIENRSVYHDIGEYRIEVKDGKTYYKFFDAWEDDRLCLTICAGKAEIYEVGTGAGINEALLDTGYEYIGGQSLEAE